MAAHSLRWFLNRPVALCNYVTIEQGVHLYVGRSRDEGTRSVGRSASKVPKTVAIPLGSTLTSEPALPAGAGMDLALPTTPDTSSSARECSLSPAGISSPAAWRR